MPYRTFLLSFEHSNQLFRMGTIYSFVSKTVTDDYYNEMCRRQIQFIMKYAEFNGGV